MPWTPERHRVDARGADVTSLMPGRDVVGLCGSLRSASLNRLVLDAAGSAMPDGMALDVIDYRDVPPFDADALSAGMPAAVARLRERLSRADGLIIATPEYNFSIPGMLKNTLDWLSRGQDQPLAGMPVAILSASTGMLGGARVQYELRRVLQCVNAMPMAKPEVFVGQANVKFDDDGGCNDALTRSLLATQMLAFAAWIDRVRVMSSDPRSPPAS